MKASVALFLLFFSCIRNTEGQINLVELKKMINDEVSIISCPQLGLKSIEYLKILFAEKGRESLFLSKINEMFNDGDSVALIYSENGEIQIDHLYLFDVNKKIIKHYVLEYHELIEEKSFINKDVNLSTYFQNYDFLCSNIPSEISGSYMISNIDSLNVKIISGKSIYEDLLVR